jgi:alkylation response protein AidB-like acyl-CoA dehydrogenase
VQLEPSAEQEALRHEARKYFEDLMTPEARRASLGSPLYRQIVRQMGRDGWLGVGWPREYGGQGRSPIDQLVVFDEISRAGAPFPFVTINTVGSTMMRFGNDEQKQRFLPRILNGEMEFAIGYTEPGAGTDLASLTTRAIRDGDSYVVNGAKVFTSGADFCEYVWLACRTDPEAERHRGLSILMVPTDSPGFSWSPIETLLDNRITTSTFYDDVRVPVENLIGEENKGWRLITSQLNHERVMMAQASFVVRLLGEVRGWAQQTRLADGRRVIDQDWVQLHLARVEALVEYVRLGNIRTTTADDSDPQAPAWASAAKVYSSEMSSEALKLLFEVCGPQSYLRLGSPGAVLGAGVEAAYRLALQTKTGGGTNEIQRELIGAFGLGMARAPR